MNCEMCIGFLMVSSSQGAKIDLTLIGFVLTILRPGVAHAWLPCNAASALCYCFLLLLPSLLLLSLPPGGEDVPDHLRRQLPSLCSDMLLLCRRYFQ